MLEITYETSCTDGDLIQSLKSKHNLDLRERNVRLLLQGIKRDFAKAGAVYYKKVATLYAKFINVDMVVRREEPLAVMRCIANNEPIGIAFDPAVNSSMPYPNCSDWNPSCGPAGLINAIFGGFTEIAGVIFVVGFKPRNCKLAQVELTEEQRRCCCANPKFKGDPRLYRCAQGQIFPSDIMMIIIGCPPKLFPEAEIDMDDEKEYDDWNDNRVPFILRGYAK